MKILVISLAGIGDTLMATPLIHELRAHFPSATIDVLVMWAGSRDLLEGNPHLNTVFHHNFIKSGLLNSLRSLHSLRKCGYDVSFNTYPQSRVAYRLVAQVINARKRLTHRYDHWSLMDRLLSRDAIEQDYGLHAAQNNLNLLKLLGLSPKLPRHEYELFLTPDEKAQATVSGKTLGLHVGSGTTKNLPLRRWPLEHWIELIQRILGAHPDVRVLLFGGPEEKEDHERILSKVRHSRLSVPETGSLRQAAALVAKCDVFASVDTALMHLAAAGKVPRQIVIETPTFNKTVTPYGRPYVLVPNPMVGGRNLEYYRYDGRGIQGTPEHLRACMRSMTVDAVFAELSSALLNES